MRRVTEDLNEADRSGGVEASTPMPRVRVAHSGKQHAYRHALALDRAGALDRFITSSYFKPHSLPDRWLAKLPRLAGMLRRRWQEGLPESKVVRRWRLELPELIARRLLGPGETAERCMFRRDAAFDRWVARRWARDCDVFWGFQGSCLDSLKAARGRGLVAVAEFATAHVTKAIELLSAEAQRHPEWADSISNLHFPGWYRERLEQEPHEADYCIAASQFTRQSLLEVGIGPEKIQLLPLGADLTQFTPSRRSVDGPFRVLFVGGIGQRKGIKYLLEAYRRIHGPGMELVLVGPMCGSGKALAEYAGLYSYKGRLDQRGVINEMRRCHVLLLPSVFEGFGLVIAEAMATGMPVIASTNSIGPELIREGVDGFVLAPDDVEGLADRITRLASHRAQNVEMGACAAAGTRRLSWDNHELRLVEILRSMTGESASIVQSSNCMPLSNCSSSESKCLKV